MSKYLDIVSAFHGLTYLILILYYVIGTISTFILEVMILEETVIMAGVSNCERDSIFRRCTLLRFDSFPDSKPICPSSEMCFLPGGCVNEKKGNSEFQAES